MTPPELSPEIVLFHILPKLPGKSLLRFKCVCKQWRSFLATPLFANIHLHHLTTVDPHRHEKVLFMASTATSGPLAAKMVQSPSLVVTHYNQNAWIVASSVNGLVCVGILKHTTTEFFDMTIWNPLTGEYKMLSKPIDTKCYSRNAMAFELYYSCSDDDQVPNRFEWQQLQVEGWSVGAGRASLAGGSTADGSSRALKLVRAYDQARELNNLDDDYKILSITTDRNVYIYSLRSDSWRKLESTLDHEDRIPCVGDHNLLDKKLHFLMGKRSRYIIIRFDLKTQKFTKIAVPPSCGRENLSLMVVRGCIELTRFRKVLRGTRMIEMWRMNGDGKWMQIVNISYPPDVDRTMRTKPLYLLRNGNLIVKLTFYGIGISICKVDPKKNYTEDELCSGSTIGPLRTYIETFVSPNQYVT
ncbi:LOW QUALITY PROTEIN: hypothetical protein OSB04_010072 [Centaurea solstitialis]|uniref:F-box domain-containing protein n=1 Tax=Centaurea solstitialis TaxID=347529 RepID=A0AA38TRP2_9ASTR|nr:LOW QUALITY PROTEIN: hypothetical protein OSB04_010072 [Centaurea solstitialis]